MIDVIAAIFLVDVIGYIWHRFVEHGSGGLSRWHRRHHQIDYPPGDFYSQFSYRENSDPAWFLVFAIVFALTSVFALLGTIAPASAVMLLATASLYAWILNALHWRFHVLGHGLWKWRWFQALARMHVIHHGYDANYGIVTFWVDWLCGTRRLPLPSPS